jgi:hypothetical protein
MKKAVLSFVLVALLFCAPLAGQGGRFDGKWQTTLSCDRFKDALGFSWEFVSIVKAGNLRGQYGVEGKPASLVIEGKIGDDGTAMLHTTVHTGKKEYTPGQDTPPGTEVTYHVKATFKDTSGKGTRVEGRPCTYDFVKQ